VNEELGYLKEYFQGEIKAFELNKFENRAAPYFSVDEVYVWARDPYPWDDEVVTLLKPFNEAKWGMKKTDGKIVLKRE
jgi:hypothetical protein